MAFAGDAFLQCPTTIDYAAFLMMLDDVYAGLVPIGGTDLFQALETSLESFEKAEETQADKVIIASRLRAVIAVCANVSQVAKW